MSGFFDYLLDILGEFGGGRGDGKNDFVRFGLAAILWSVLFGLAWAARRNKRSARESLLLVGFAFGWSREIFKLVIKSLEIYGHVDKPDLELFFPPIDHALLYAARIVVGAAFLRFLADDVRLTRRYLVAGLGAGAVFYVITAPAWWNAVEADPEIRFSMFWGDWVIHSLGAVFSAFLIGYLVRVTSGSLRWCVVAAFGLFFLDDALMLVNLATDEIHKAAYGPIRHNAHLVGIAVLGGVYLLEARAEQLRLRAQLRQSERLEAVGQLAAGVAHDFNNILQVMLGYAEVAQLAAGDDEQTEVALDALSHITAAGHRAGDLIDQLLTFSKQAEPSVIPVDVNELTTRLVPFIGRLVGPDVTISLVLEPEIATVEADLAMMEQVLLNLTVNARDAMPDGGTLTITTTNASDGDGSSWVELHVSDTGIGMDAATRERIFEPFFTTKPHGEGTGLGLATVHGIVERHGGTFDVESSPGEGTEIVVRLPASDAPRPAVAADARRTGRPRPSTVLLAEDDHAVATVTAAMLRAEGHDVTEAVNGDEAIAAVRERGGEFDLLVLDVAMPRVDGYSAYDQISRDHEIPVLFISGSTHRFRDDRIDRPHLRKPFTMTDLLDAVDGALEGEGANDSVG